MARAKHVSISRDQAEALFRQWMEVGDGAGQIEKLLEAVVSVMMKRRVDFWTEVAALCGYDSFEKMALAGITPRVDWSVPQIVLKSRPISGASAEPEDG